MDKIVLCEKCGAMVKVLVDCTCVNCGIKCCGETMKEISVEEANKILAEKKYKLDKKTLNFSRF